MAMTPEAKVKKKVVDKLKRAGAYYFYPVTGGYGSSGLFDIVCAYKGRFVGIECKADMKKKGPTPLQSRNARQAKSSGCIVLLVDSSNLSLVDDVFEALKGEHYDTGEESDRLSFWPFDGVTS